MKEEGAILEKILKKTQGQMMGSAFTLPSARQWVAPTTTTILRADMSPRGSRQRLAR